MLKSIVFKNGILFTLIGLVGTVAPNSAQAQTGLQMAINVVLQAGSSGTFLASIERERQRIRHERQQAVAAMQLRAEASANRQLIAYHQDRIRHYEALANQTQKTLTAARLYQRDLDKMRRVVRSWLTLMNRTDSSVERIRSELTNLEDTANQLRAVLDGALPSTTDENETCFQDENGPRCALRFIQRTVAQLQNQLGAAQLLERTGLAQLLMSILEEKRLVEEILIAAEALEAEAKTGAQDSQQQLHALRRGRA